MRSISSGGADIVVGSCKLILARGFSDIIQKFRLKAISKKSDDSEEDFRERESSFSGGRTPVNTEPKSKRDERSATWLCCCCCCRTNTLLERERERGPPSIVHRLLRLALSSSSSSSSSAKMLLPFSSSETPVALRAMRLTSAARNASTADEK